MRYEIEKTATFDRWLKKLRDRKAVLAFTKRLTRITFGNFGDYKPVSDSVFELRFFIGPGYRVYYTIRREKIVLLLVGGDKNSQEKNIQKAIDLVRKLEE